MQNASGIAKLSHSGALGGVTGPHDDIHARLDQLIGSVNCFGEVAIQAGDIIGTEVDLTAKPAAVGIDFLEVVLHQELRNQSIHGVNAGGPTQETNDDRIICGSGGIVAGGCL